MFRASTILYQINPFSLRLDMQKKYFFKEWKESIAETLKEEDKSDMFLSLLSRSK
jgi:hypothetical protein